MTYAAPVFGVTAMVEVSAFCECRFMSATHVIDYPTCPYSHTGISVESNSVHPVLQMAHIPIPNAELTGATVCAAGGESCWAFLQLRKNILKIAKQFVVQNYIDVLVRSNLV